MTLPEDGWYPPRTADGVVVRPLAARAWLRVAPGWLRVISVNCYPSCGPSRVRVAADGGGPVVLEAPLRAETRIFSTEGRLEFEAERLFTAEETGGTADVGGWIAVIPEETEQPRGKDTP